MFLKLTTESHSVATHHPAIVSYPLERVADPNLGSACGGAIGHYLKSHMIPKSGSNLRAQYIGAAWSLSTCSSCRALICLKPN